jgi:hypothetical protein
MQALTAPCHAPAQTGGWSYREQSPIERTSLTRTCCIVDAVALDELEEAEAVEVLPDDSILPVTSTRLPRCFARSRESPSRT